LTKLRRLKPISFNIKAQIWKEVNYIDSKASINKLHIISYNIMHDYGEFLISDVANTSMRFYALCNLLEKENADIIALQEVSFGIYKKLLQQDWVRNRYYVCENKGESVDPYGTLILSKFPPIKILNRVFPGTPKNMTLVDFLVNEKILSLGNVHLKAGSEFKQNRITQVSYAVEWQKLSEASEAILIGDFNFREEQNEKIEIFESNYNDIWPTLHTKEEFSMTFSIDKNPFAKLISERLSLIRHSKPYSSRYDRIYLRKGSKFNAKSISLLGMDSIGKDTIYNEYDVFISDHFGISIHFQLV